LLLVLEAGLLGLPDARGSLFGVSFFMMAFLLFGVVSCASNWTVAKASSMTGPRITDCNGTGSLDPLPDSLVDELVLLDPLVFFAQKKMMPVSPFSLLLPFVQLHLLGIA